MKKIDIYIGISLIVLSILVLISASSLPSNEGLDVGPDFFPRWGSYALIVLCSILIINGIRSKEQSKERLFSRNVTLGVCLTFGYLLLVYLIGFHISTAVFLIAFMWLFNYRKWIHICSVTAFIVLFIYFVFEWFLHVPLPSGLWF